MHKFSLTNVSDWIDGVSALWKVGAVVALLAGATIGMIRTGAASGSKFDTHITQTDTILQQHHTLISQNDTIIFQLRELNRHSVEQLCVTTHVKSDWGDCIK